MGLDTHHPSQRCDIGSCSSGDKGLAQALRALWATALITPFLRDRDTEYTNAMKLKKAASDTARKGVSARFEITVVIELAASWERVEEIKEIGDTDYAND